MISIKNMASDLDLHFFCIIYDSMFLEYVQEKIKKIENRHMQLYSGHGVNKSEVINYVNVKHLKIRRR